MQEYTSGIIIEYKKDKNKCKLNNCVILREKILTDIEQQIEMIEYLDNNTIEDISCYDCDCENEFKCEYCNNVLTFKYNPYLIYKKYK